MLIHPRLPYLRFIDIFSKKRKISGHGMFDFVTGKRRSNGNRSSEKGQYSSTGRKCLHAQRKLSKNIVLELSTLFLN